MKKLLIASCTALLVSACGPIGAPSAATKVTPVISVANATQVARTFWNAQEQARAKQDFSLEKAYVAAPLALQDSADIAVVKAAGFAADVYSLQSLTVYVSATNTYPAQFVAVARQTSPTAAPEVDAAVFNQDHAGSPWVVEDAVPIDVNTPFPAISSDGQTVLPIPDVAQSTFLQGSADDAMTEYGKEVIGSLQVAPVHFATGDNTSALAQNLLDSNQQADSDTCKCLSFSASALPSSAPSFVFRDAAGDGIAFMSIRESSSWAYGNNYSTTQDKQRSNWTPLLAPGQYSDITEYDTLTFVADIPPVGSSRLITMIGGDDQITSATGQ